MYKEQENLNMEEDGVVDGSKRTFTHEIKVCVLCETKSLQLPNLTFGCMSVNIFLPMFTQKHSPAKKAGSPNTWYWLVCFWHWYLYSIIVWMNGGWCINILWINEQLFHILVALSSYVVSLSSFLSRWQFTALSDQIKILLITFDAVTCMSIGLMMDVAQLLSYRSKKVMKCGCH